MPTYVSLLMTMWTVHLYDNDLQKTLILHNFQKEQKVFECWTNSAALQDRVMGGILEDGLYEVRGD